MGSLKGNSVETAEKGFDLYVNLPPKSRHLKRQIYFEDEGNLLLCQNKNPTHRVQLLQRAHPTLRPRLSEGAKPAKVVTATIIAAPVADKKQGLQSSSK